MKKLDRVRVLRGSTALVAAVFLAFAFAGAPRYSVSRLRPQEHA